MVQLSHHLVFNLYIKCRYFEFIQREEDHLTFVLTKKNIFAFYSNSSRAHISISRLLYKAKKLGKMNTFKFAKLSNPVVKPYKQPLIKGDP